MVWKEAKEARQHWQEKTLRLQGDDDEQGLLKLPTAAGARPPLTSPSVQDRSQHPLRLINSRSSTSGAPERPPADVDDSRARAGRWRTEMRAWRLILRCWWLGLRPRVGSRGVGVESSVW